MNATTLREKFEDATVEDKNTMSIRLFDPLLDVLEAAEKMDPGCVCHVAGSQCLGCRLKEKIAALYRRAG